MSLSEPDREWIRMTAKELTYEVIKNVLSEHIAACPHGQSISKAKWVVIGLGLGASAAGGGGLVAGLMSLLK